MLLLALSIAALSVGARDTSTLATIVASPTVSHTPVINIKAAISADSIVVEKSKHTLTLYSFGIPVRSYPIALGAQPKGDKIKAGDGRTPEGLYYIDYKNSQSKYHLALHISYPDAAHADRARKLGASPGGDIMVHGLPPAFADLGDEQRTHDWTEGCIAVTNREIEEIFRAVPQGSPIDIKP